MAGGHTLSLHCPHHHFTLGVGGGVKQASSKVTKTVFKHNCPAWPVWLSWWESGPVHCRGGLWFWWGTGTGGGRGPRGRHVREETNGCFSLFASLK